jgi:FkbM family methyltransferase
MHPIFELFPPQKSDQSKEFLFNFLGVRIRRSFCRSLTNRNPPSDELPAVNEEYFEWIDLLEAVATSAGRFVMMELGAGYGRWLANAAGASRMLRRPYYLLAVEAEPVHFRFLARNLRDNGVPVWRSKLVRAAVGAAPGHVWFHVGQPTQWYGQAIDRYRQPIAPTLLQRLARRPIREALPDGTQRELVRVVSLDQLLRPWKHVDLIDLDVQGAELDVLAASEQLDRKVRRVHIGTHDPEVEAGLRRLFARLGWINRGDYPCLTANVPTPYGRVTFQDGVQSWVNPKLAIVPKDLRLPERSAA